MNGYLHIVKSCSYGSGQGLGVGLGVGVLGRLVIHRGTHFKFKNMCCCEGIFTYSKIMHLWFRARGEGRVGCWGSGGGTGYLPRDSF